MRRSSWGKYATRRWGVIRLSVCLNATYPKTKLDEDAYDKRPSLQEAIDRQEER